MPESINEFIWQEGLTKQKTCQTKQKYVLIVLRAFPE